MSAVVPLTRMRSQDRDDGFTLVELLVVVAIIMLLVAVSVSYLSQARQKAKKVANQAQINSLNLACEAYQLSQGAYPGIWTNSNLGSQTLSGSEMMVASLVGGVVPSTPAPPGPNLPIPPQFTSGVAGAETRTYSLPKVGSGPVSGFSGFSGTTDVTSSVQKLEAYYPAKDGEIVDFDGNGFCEIMDRSTVGMPVLFYRAFVGRPGVAFNSTQLGSNTSQYNFDHNRKYFDNTRYKTMRTLADMIAKPPPTSALPDTTRQSYQHALATDKKFASYITALPTVPSGTAGWDGKDGWSSIANANNPPGARPFNTDRFLLISAGEDAYFGPNPNFKSTGTLLGDIQQCDDVFNWSRQ